MSEPLRIQAMGEYGEWAAAQTILPGDQTFVHPMGESGWAHIRGSGDFVVLHPDDPRLLAPIPGFLPRGVAG